MAYVDVALPLDVRASNAELNLYFAGDGATDRPAMALIGLHRHCPVRSAGTSGNRGLEPRCQKARGFREFYVGKQKPVLAVRLIAQESSIGLRHRRGGR